MSKDEFVMDKDILSLYPERQEFAFDDDAIKKPKKPADGAAVERAFDKFMALIERLLN